MYNKITNISEVYLMAILNNTQPAKKNTASEPETAKAHVHDNAKPVLPQRKLKKSEKIALQNILFGTNVKKVMTSEEFLMDMTVKYISKRMKSVNINYENMRNTKQPSTFFKYYDQIEACLDDLVKIESYYTFKQPVPSAYQKILNGKLPEMITQMLNRAWKYILQKYPFTESVPEQSMEQYDAVINEMLTYRRHYSESDIALIDSFYRSVHGDETDESGEAEQANASDE